MKKHFPKFSKIIMLIIVLTSYNCNNNKDPKPINNLCETPKYLETFGEDFPHPNAYFDYKQGIACAKKQNKPILLVFAAYGAIHYQRMKQEVFAKKKVRKLIETNYVFIVLYVDGRRRLPKEDVFYSEITEDSVRTIGGENSDFQIQKCQCGTQPFTMILDSNGSELVSGIRSHKEKEFLDFLENGIKVFSNKEL